MRAAAPLALLAAAAFAACHHTPVPQTTSGGIGPGTQAPPPVAGGAAASAGAPAPRPLRRPRPDPRIQDSIRRATVAEIALQIAGKENLPASQVFRNVQVLKDMPAGEFLRNMDEGYGRGLGWVCSNCHVVGQFDSDNRKNKRIAREMQRMTNVINEQELPQNRELDEDYRKVTCVMCHRGSNNPPNRMAQPLTAPAESR